MSQLDFYFPFFVFFYGILMIFVLDNPQFLRLQGEFAKSAFGVRFSMARRGAGFIWVVVIFSGLWAAQNLLFSI